MSTATSTSFPIRWYVSVAVVLFIFVLVALNSSQVAEKTTGYDDDQAKLRTGKLAKLQAADEKTLTTADWVDKDKGVVRIPIDEAMTQEVTLLQAKPVAAGTEIPGAVAPASTAASSSTPASAPAATNAPSGTPPASTNAAPTGNAPPPPKPTK